MSSFVAQYQGTCAGCGDGIIRGDLVRYVDDRLVHEDCDDLPPEPVAKVCPICHLTACDCDE